MDKSYRTGHGLRFLLLLVGCVCFSSLGFAGTWLEGTVLEYGALVYREPNVLSDTLGKYPSGMVIRVYSDDYQGFYSMYFQTPWKDAHYVWVPAHSVRLNYPRRTEIKSFKLFNFELDADHKFEYSRHSVGLAGSLFFFNPSAYEATLGLAPSGLSPSFGFDLEYCFRFESRLAISFRGRYYKFSRSLYQFSGMSGIINFIFLLIPLDRHQLQIELGSGVSINQLIEQSGSYSKLLGLPVSFSMASILVLSHQNHLFIENRIGYELHSIGYSTANNVAIVLNTPVLSSGLVWKW